jgi:hypothetical protein
VALSDRIPYQAQIDRPKLTLPDGKKLAVWVILNVEEWRIESAMPRTVLPQDIATPHGPITTIPYSVETNDIVIHALQHLPSEQFLKRCTDQFDRLYLEGASNARIMAISIHPYITGVPHRIKYLEALLDYVIGHDGVALMTASEIGDWYRAETANR